MGQSHPRVGKQHRQQFRTDGRLTAAQRVLYAARAERILSLRVTGLSESQIGVQEDISYRAVHSIIRASIKRKTRNSPEAQHLRELELDRLDQLQKGIWASACGQAEGGEGLVNLKAVDRVLRIMERRAALLGLDLRADSTAGDEVRLTLEQLVIQSGLGSGQAGPSPGVSARVLEGGPTPAVIPISGTITHKDGEGAVQEAEFKAPENFSVLPESPSPESPDGVEPFTEEG